MAFFLRALFLALVGTLFIVPFSVSALSCAPVNPQIGTVGTLPSDKQNFSLTLLDAQPLTIGEWNSTILDLDAYMKIVERYIAGETLGAVTEGEYSWIPPIILAPEELKHLDVRVGDIIINAPPFHVCSFGFTGIFSNTGALRHAVINESFNDYTFQGKTLLVEPDKVLSCDEAKCRVSVAFSYGGKNISLKHKESREFGNSIKRVSLLDASDYIYDKDGNPTSFDWGFGKYARYVVNFEEGSEGNPNVCNDTLPSQSKMGCSQIPHYDGNGCIVSYSEECQKGKPKSSFGGFFKWLFSLFF